MECYKYLPSVDMEDNPLDWWKHSHRAVILATLVLFSTTVIITARCLVLGCKIKIYHKSDNTTKI